MTANTQESTFNVFHILSAGDKELVHSSMLKFLIEEYPIFRKEFLGEEFEHNIELYIKLEHSDNIKEETDDENKVKPKNKRLRFDLLGYDKPENGKLLFAIENKFKATPTVHQLMLYDKYFNKQKVLDVIKPSQKASKPSSKKVILAENFKKYLIVFSEEQIPSDVKEYCEKENWEIRSYFQLNDKSSIENLLEKIEILDKNKNFIAKQYNEFISNKSTELEKYLGQEKFVSFAKKNREVHFRYLLHIQKLISDKQLELDPNSEIKYSTGNDGGKNTIPSINFILEGIKFNHQNIRAAFFGIDGDTIKIGVYYFRDKKENKGEIEQYLEDVQNVIWEDLKAKNLKSLQLKKETGRNINLKESKDGTNIGSAFSLFTFESKEKKLDEVINDCANLLNMYFKIF